jgi:hypothetical protein
MPLMGQMSQMGLLTARDIMGTSMAMKMMGPAAGAAMMGTMQQGAQMSRAMGGTLRAGAQLGAELFQNVNTAAKTGTLSEEQIIDYTGGVGGEQGQRQVATALQQVLINMTQHPGGVAMMAGLAEVKDGKVVGIDKKKMEMFMRGELSTSELIRSGQRNLGSREAKLSFMNKRQELGQEMIAQGGMGAMQQLVSGIAEKAGLGEGDDVFERLMMQVGGADAKTAELAMNMMKKMGGDNMQRRRDLSATLEATIRKNEYKRNRSWEGLMTKIGHWWDESVESPLNKVAEGITTSMGEAIDEAADTIMGRTRPMPKFGGKDLMRAIEAGDLGKNVGTMESLGVHENYQEWMEGEGSKGGWFSHERITERGDVLQKLGMKTHVVGGETPMGAEEVEIGRIGLVGGGFNSRRAYKADVEAKMQTVDLMRSEGGGIDTGKEGSDNAQALQSLSAAMTRIVTDPKQYRELLALKASDPERYKKVLADRLKDAAPDAFKKLAGVAQGKGSIEDKAQMVVNKTLDAAGFGKTEDFSVLDQSEVEKLGSLYGTAAEKAFHSGLDVLTRSSDTSPELSLLGGPRPGAGLSKTEAEAMMGAVGRDVALAAKGGTEGLAAQSRLIAFSLADKGVAGGAVKKFLAKGFDDKSQFLGSEEDIKKLGLSSDILSAKRKQDIEKDIGKEAVGAISNINQGMTLDQLKETIASAGLGKLEGKEMSKLAKMVGPGGLLTSEGAAEARRALGEKAYKEKSVREETIKGGMEAALAMYSSTKGVLRVMDVTDYATKDEVNRTKEDMKSAQNANTSTPPSSRPK